MKPLVTILFSALCVLPLHASFPAGSNTFSSATAIPSTVTQDSSNATTLDACTAEAGEPDYTGVKRTAWWFWLAPTDGWATFSTEDNPFPGTELMDTHLAVFTGTVVNNLGLVGRNDDGMDSLQSRVSFYAKAGTVYRVQVDSGYAGNTGQVVLNLRYLPAKALRILGSGSDSGLFPVQFSVSATALGAVTGRLVYDGKAYTLKGVAGVDGYFTAQVARAPLPGGQPVAPLKLIVDLVPTSLGYHQCWVQNGVNSAVGVKAYKVTPFTTAAPHPLAPRFTGIVNLSGANAGRGYVTATLTKSGAVAISGRTGDGKSFTTSSALCDLQNGQYAAPLGSGAGMLTGVMGFDEKPAGTDLLDGWDLRYRRPVPTTGVFYPNGIAVNVSMAGAAYQAPAAGQRALGFLNASAGAGKIVLDTVAGEYMGATLNTVFSVGNLFTFPGSTIKTTLTLNRTTGVVTGTSALKPGKPALPIRGVLTLENGAPIIYGHVVGTTRTAYFRVGM